jgi:hypothetical protein
LELAQGQAGSYDQASQLMHAQSDDRPTVDALRAAIGLESGERGSGVVDRLAEMWYDNSKGKRNWPVPKEELVECEVSVLAYRT